MSCNNLYISFFLYLETHLKQRYNFLQHKIGKIILSTVLGFVPFIINGQNEVFWFALGVGTIGGIVFSFLALFIFMPLMVLKVNKVS